jgi:hypothetical protein
METCPEYEKSPLAELSKAFESAWAVLQRLIRDPNKHEALKLQLQCMLLKLAADGVADAQQLSSLAVDKLSAEQNPQELPLAAEGVHDFVRKVEPQLPQAEQDEEKARVRACLDALKNAQATGREKVGKAVRGRMEDKAPKQKLARHRRPEVKRHGHREDSA